MIIKSGFTPVDFIVYKTIKLILFSFQINEETSEVIVNNAIDLWQQSGSVLTTPPPNNSINVQNSILYV